MNESKIVLPKNVAAAIAHYVNLADTKTEALTDILSMGYEATRSEIILRHFDGNHDELMEALICGYDVVETPEDRVRDFYNATRHDKVNFYYQRAIIGTLDRLGIKIEGVNEE
jgi:hypothetical protein